MYQKVITLISKIAILVLALPLLWATVITVSAALPKIVFVAEPFFHLSSGLLVAGLTTTLVAHSKEPVLWTALWVISSAILLVYQTVTGLFLAILLLSAAINFIHRNRFTETPLIFLPILSGALLLLHPLYSSYLGVWAYYTTNINPFADTSLASQVYRAGVQILMVAPFMAMYLLGKHHHQRLYVTIRKWRRSRTEST